MVRGWRLFLFVFFLGGCSTTWQHGTEPALFGQRIDGGEVGGGHLDEISGIAASRLHRGFFWVHNDSGDTNRVYLLDEFGELYGEMWLAGCSARDWEDIAVGPGPEPDQSYIYIGDIGDNLGVHRERHICRVPEPVRLSLSASRLSNFNLKAQAQELTVIFNDRARDAETLLLDPNTNDLYIVTKRESAVYVYYLPYPQPFGGQTRVDPLGTIPISGVTGGDISPDGRELLLKTNSAVYYWRRAENQSWYDTMAQPARRAPYVREPQGEAIGWTATGDGYVTVSEKVFLLMPHIYIYPRLTH